MVLRRLSAQRENEHGFTLIELLVVILIIGILAAIAIPMFLNQRQAAAEASLRSDMKNMATHMYTFFAQDHGNIDRLKSYTHATGWAVIVRDDGAKFSGNPSNSIEGDLYPDGMDPFTVSDGVALGVVTYASETRNREGGEFCILGNHEGTKYKAKYSSEGISGWSYPLYYDSASGGFYESDELLESTGACLDYGKRMVSGS